MKTSGQSLENESLAGRSGGVEDSRRLVSFLYELMRDHLPPGLVEEALRQSPARTTTYTNGWLARYAQDVADRLLTEQPAKMLAYCELSVRTRNLLAKQGILALTHLQQLDELALQHYGLDRKQIAEVRELMEIEELTWPLPEHMQLPSLGKLLQESQITDNHDEDRHQVCVTYITNAKAEALRCFLIEARGKERNRG